MAKEVVGQRRVMADPGAPAAERATKGVDVGHAHIGELAVLDVAPDELDRIQLRRIARQPFDREPRALLRQVVLHEPTAVRVQAIPDQDDGLAAKVSFEAAQERDQRTLRKGARSRPKEEAGTPTVPPETQRARNGQALPVPADGLQDGRFAARRPGAPDDGLLREPTFVLEDEPRVPAAGVFFSCTHRRVFHVVIAGSLRSRACWAGRCNDHPNRRSTRQTWPGWYRTPVRRSITVATRGKVHRSVLKPCASGPARIARSTSASCAPLSRGLRPARPAPLSPARPSACQAWNQWWALTRVTPSALATATCDSPRANSRAACSRRVSIAAKSRVVVGMRQHAIVPMKSVSLFGESH